MLDTKGRRGDKTLSTDTLPGLQDGAPETSWHLSLQTQALLTPTSPASPSPPFPAVPTWPGALAADRPSFSGRQPCGWSWLLAPGSRLLPGVAGGQGRLLLGAGLGLAEGC